MGLKVTVDTTELEELHEKLQADPKPIMARIADRLVGTLRGKLQSASPSPAKSTLAIRRQRGSGGDAALIDLGKMLDSVRPRSSKNTAAAVVSWPALVLDTGFTTAPDSAIPGKAVPARTFVVLEDADVDYALDQAEELYLGD